MVKVFFIIMKKMKKEDFIMMENGEMIKEREKE